ncbi:hypothetical protein Tsubulata_049515 [Turnera subulata]|uniref:KIB1-4 beta-propeller domain-containing protein n=1 Tax=Turnera subulata TaxID=218843 RepID=A0A9Q0J0Y1_9ROSI|nr:hypothetical protein Tsubulata_049515 [Turnera subulata]
MQNKSICACSNDGWLVLKDSQTDDYHLYNPISTTSFQLPSLALEANIMECFLCSTPDDDSNCRVVFFETVEDTTTMWYCRLGDEEFLRKDIVGSLCYGAVFQAKLYCFVWPEKTLALINFETSNAVEFTPIMVGLPNIVLDAGIFHSVTYLIECSGELLLVVKMYYCFPSSCPDRVEGFRVLRFDFSKKTLVEQQDIGGWTIFLSYGRAMSCLAKEAGVKPNSIYFVERKDRNLHAFHIEDQSFTMSLPCPTISRSDSLLDWIMKLSVQEGN